MRAAAASISSLGISIYLKRWEFATEDTESAERNQNTQCRCLIQITHSFAFLSVPLCVLKGYSDVLRT